MLINRCQLMWIDLSNSMVIVLITRSIVDLPLIYQILKQICRIGPLWKHQMFENRKFAWGKRSTPMLTLESAMWSESTCGKKCMKIFVIRIQITMHSRHLPCRYLIKQSEMNLKTSKHFQHTPAFSQRQRRWYPQRSEQLADSSQTEYITQNMRWNWVYWIGRTRDETRGRLRECWTLNCRPRERTTSWPKNKNWN